MKDEEIASKTRPQALLERHLTSPTPLYHEIGFLKFALKFVVTRHPYQRLVAAYKVGGKISVQVGVSIETRIGVIWMGHDRESRGSLKTKGI